MIEAVITRGFWCEGCEMYEDPAYHPEDPAQPDICMGCGCKEGDHVQVKIVMIEAGNE